MLLYPGYLVLFLALISYLGEVHPAFDSISHFRFHLSAVAIILAFLVLVFQRRKAALPLFAAGLIVCFHTATWIMPARGGAIAGTDAGVSATYKLLHMNVRFDNLSPNAVLSLIAAEQPDVISLNEVSTLWQEPLHRIATAYPHQLICQRRSVIGGVAILSRRPFVGKGHCLHDSMMAWQQVDLNGHVVNFISVHMHWPWPFRQPVQTEEMIADLTHIADEPSVMSGDFNAVPWSATLRAFRAASGMEIIRGIGATWLPYDLSRFLPADFGLPIDQILAATTLDVSAHRLNNRAGSDHLPVLAEIKISEVRRLEPRELVQLSD